MKNTSRLIVLTLLPAFGAACLSTAFAGPKVIALSLNVAASGTLSISGHEDLFTFTGATGQRLYYDTLDLTNENLTVQLVAPSGALVGLTGYGTHQELAPFYLLETGLYTLKIDGVGDATGPYNFRMVDAGAASLLTVGPTNTVVLNPSTRTEVFRLAGTAGQRIYLRSISDNTNSASWTLINPANASMSSSTIDNDLGTNLLPVTGSYLIVVAGTDPAGPQVNFSFRITDVSEAAVSPTGFGVVHSGTTLAGATNTYTYSAPAGTVVYYDSLTNAGSDSVSVVLTDPVGTALYSYNASYDSGPVFLPHSGVYTLQLIAPAAGPGNYIFRLLNLTTASTPLTTGNTNTGTLSPAFRADVFRFQGTPGQRIFYDPLDANFTSVTELFYSPGLVNTLSGPGASDSGLFTLSEPGTFYLVESSSTADASVGYSFRLLDLAQPPAMSLAFNTSITNALDPASRTDLHRFNGVAGQRLFFNALGTDNRANWYLLDPQNNAVGQANVINDFTLTLSKTGTYALEVVGSGATPIPYAFRVITAATTNFPLTLGATTTGTLTAVGEEDHYTFTGAAGQRLFYDALQNDGANIAVRLLDPRGNNVFLNQGYNFESASLTLPESGQYTLVIGGLSSALGGYTFRLIDLSQAPVQPLTFNTVYTGSNTVPLSAMFFRFTGVAGQHLFFNSQFVDSAAWGVYRTDNYPLANTTLGSDFELTLTETGTYLLWLESGVTNAFGYSFRVLNSTTITLPLTLGTVVSNSFTDAGDEFHYTFTATNGQRLFYDGLADGGLVSVSLQSPNGYTYWNGSVENDGHLFTVTDPGAYTLVLHNGSNHGVNYAFRVLDLASQPAVTLGTVVTNELNPQSEAQLYRFLGAAGQTIHLASLSTSSTIASWTILGPANNDMVTENITADLGTVALPVSGTYAVQVQGLGDSTGTLDYQFVVTNVTSAPVTASGFGTYTGTLPLNGSNFVHFSAQAGTHIFIDTLTNNASANGTLYDTNGTVVLQGIYLCGGDYYAWDPGVFILPTSGIYTLEIVQSGQPTGDYSFRILNLETDALPLTIGARTAGPLTTGYQSVVYSFTGSPGQRVLYDGLEGDNDPVYVSFIAPSGTYIFRAGQQWWSAINADGDWGPYTLTESGKYYFSIQSGVPDTNHYTFRVLDLNQAPTVLTSLGVTNGTGLVPVPPTLLSVTGSYVDMYLGAIDQPDWRTSQSIAGTRTDALISFYTTNWGSRASVGLTGGADTNWQNFSVQWDGTVTVTNANTSLYLISSDGSRIWIDLNNDGVFESTELLNNGWGGNQSPVQSFASPPLAPGTYRIRIQYGQATDSGVMALLWDNGYNVGPYEAQVFRFNANAGPLFFQSFQSASPSWYHYRPENDNYTAAGSASAGLESTSDQPGTNLVIMLNTVAQAQPYSFRVIAPQPITNALTVGAIQHTILSAGQDFYYTFTATAGQRLYYDALDQYSGYTTLNLITPNGAALISSSYHFSDAGPFTLTETGSYTLTLHNHQGAPQSWNFRLLDVAAQPFISLDATNSFTANPGTTASLFQFNSLAHLRLFMDALSGGGSYPNSGWNLFGPNNQSLGSAGLWYDGDFTVADPPLTTTYLLVVNNLYDTNSYSFSFRIVPGNHAPVLAPVANQAVNELAFYSYTNTATDLEIGNQNLTFSLDPGAPAGLVINPITAVMSWTPTQTQSPLTYPVTVRVADDGIPPLSDFKSFNLKVIEINQSPVLSTVAPQTVDELKLLTVTNVATEPNIHSVTAGYLLLNPPAGASMDSNGVFTWTPAQTQSTNAYPITVVVTNSNPYDLVNPHLSATNTFTVVVREVNVAPVPPVIPTQTVNELTLLTVTNTASEFNIHSRLGYGLLLAPGGASIDTNGIITWTPAQTQSPSNYPITVVVTNSNPYDLINPHLSATNSFSVIVKEVNMAPVLSTIATQTVNELTLLTVTNAATEPNIHSVTAGYLLLNPPAGASIDTNGVFTWTPGQTQSPGTNLITTVVTNTNPYDLVNPHLSATNSFTVIVREVNQPPVLPSIAPQIVNEFTLLIVTNTATEPNIHALTAGYLLLNPPLGASIDASGVITWTPAEGQGPSTNILTTVVTNTDALDPSNPHLSATNSFTVVVNEINRPPVLGSLTNWTVNPGQTISFTATATDPDIPSETLTFSLVSPPAGATISASSGQFTWRPSITQANTTNVVQIQVTDSNPAAVNSQHLSDTKSFTAVINSLAPVILTPLPAAGGKFQMQINGTVGPDYTILGSTNLSAWSSITTTNPAATPFRFTDPTTGAIRYRFYRVLLGP